MQVDPAAKPKADARPDPAKYVPIETVQAMLTERNLGLATMTEDRADAKVADAMRRGHISPAMRGWATALCLEDEVSFGGFLASSPAPFAHLMRPSHMAGPPPGVRGDTPRAARARTPTRLARSSA